MNDSDTLFMLREGFFPPTGNPPEQRGILIILNVTQRESLMNCSPEDSNPAFQLQKNEDGRYSYMGNWSLVWHSSPLLLLVTRDELLLLDSGIVSFAIMGFATIRRGHKFSFVLNLTDSFHCIPTMKDLTTSLTTLVSWVSTCTV